MRAESRIWRTVEGNHVLDGDPEAAFLAYTPGDDVPDEVISELTGDTKPTRKATVKPVNKAMPKPDDK